MRNAGDTGSRIMAIPPFDHLYRRRVHFLGRVDEDGKTPFQLIDIFINIRCVLHCMVNKMLFYKILILEGTKDDCNRRC